jgi:hypothetical protein
LNLKRLFAIEIGVAVVVIVLVVFFFEVTPYLASSKQSDSVGIYHQKMFAQGVTTLALGQQASAQFNYSTYDPAILVMYLSFQSWQTPGDLSVNCNGRRIATVHASPDNPTIQLTTVSVSGWDWVKPPSLDAYTYGNEVTFVSEPLGGYEGTFSYQIEIRGSR